MDPESLTESDTLMVANFIVLLLFNAQQDIVLVRRSNTPFCNGCYALPSCTINSGETATQAALREAHRTFDLLLKPDEVVCKLVMHRTCQKSEFFMCAFQVLAELPLLLENHDVERYDDMRWFRQDALPETMVAAHRYALECIHNKVTYAEHGWLMDYINQNKLLTT